LGLTDLFGGVLDFKASAFLKFGDSSLFYFKGDLSLFYFEGDIFSDTDNMVIEGSGIFSLFSSY
jgi:hypothetical protein